MGKHSPASRDLSGIPDGKLSGYWTAMVAVLLWKRSLGLVRVLIGGLEAPQLAPLLQAPMLSVEGCRGERRRGSTRCEAFQP